MIQNSDLTQIERNAYRKFFQDGIWDILLGLMVIGAGYAPLISELGIERPWNILIAFIPSFAVLIFGKKYVTIPRLGLVKFGPKRRADRKKLIIVSSVFIFTTIILVILTKAELLPFGWSTTAGDITGPVVISLLLIGLPLSIVAYFIDFNRLYLYAVVISLTWPSTEILYYYYSSPLDEIIVFGIAGGIPLIIGLTFLVKFMIKYPLSTDKTAI
ncbi:hypothetical protein ACFL6G_00250 [candidate division KSB1 bacterium]